MTLTTDPPDFTTEPDPEDFEPAPPKAKGPLQQIPNFDGLKVPLLLWGSFWLASGYYWRSDVGEQLFISKESFFTHGEYWRAFTALGVHANVQHLLSNTPLFLIFGWFLGSFFGFRIFPIVCLLLGAATNIATVYFMPEHIRLIGASGMVYAMVPLWLVFYVRFEIHYSIFFRFCRALAFSLVVMFPTTFDPTTSYLAHGIGFLFGGIAGALLLPFVEVKELS